MTSKAGDSRDLPSGPIRKAMFLVWASRLRVTMLNTMRRYCSAASARLRHSRRVMPNTCSLP
jgi:hypothetical protein